MKQKPANGWLISCCVGKKGELLALYSHTVNQAGMLSLPLATVNVNKCNICFGILQLFFTVTSNQLPMVTGHWSLITSP
ncbi:hypothetical protein [Scytonema hofmannii]|uniref:hypothetical protein n=1 Tax=Scytonema hofmannii TaxID=34078 RepID=UPI001314D5A9|nr:hypothetical protein [Scytonema hofmannii]